MCHLLHVWYRLDVHLTLDLSVILIERQGLVLYLPSSSSFLGPFISSELLRMEVRVDQEGLNFGMEIYIYIYSQIYTL